MVDAQAVDRQIQEHVARLASEQLSVPVPVDEIVVKIAPAEFAADFSVILFPLAKRARKSPEAMAMPWVNELSNQLPHVEAAQLVKGYLNIRLKDRFWLDFLRQQWSTLNCCQFPPTAQKKMVEFCGPNTNKPLHLGHLRNMFLGHAVCNLLETVGHDVVRVNILNDRGIHICKSMLAYQLYGRHETPESSQVKGDHLVGEYYVRFETELKKQIEQRKAQGLSDEEARKGAPLMQQVQQMLHAWEAGDPQVRSLWNMMNTWVYQGFAETYQKAGIRFDKEYYESETYALGKQIVEQGAAQGIFYRKPDGSIWVDLEQEGLDHKLLLRSDGTSVYITQDIATALVRWQDYAPDQMIYTVGQEQDYHFQVLKAVCKRLQLPFSDRIHHLSYGMVDLPSGRMKSREGTVVDADDLIDEIIQQAAEQARTHGRVANLSPEERKLLYQQIGLAALKFYILRVHASKRMIYHPEESIDFQGFTGPFVQYSNARIQSMLQKAGTVPDLDAPYPSQLEPAERQLLHALYTFPSILSAAAAQLEPALLAHYLFTLAKQYNQLYQELSVLQAPTPEQRNLRLHLSAFTSNVLRKGLHILGIDAPSQM